MGCDIHVAVEARQDGSWSRIEEMVTGSVYNVELEDYVEAPVRDRWYTKRNYPLFGVLGNGSRSSAPALDVIEDPDGRGVPADASDEWLAYCHEWDGNSHSHGWATLSELLAHDWAAEHEFLNHEDWSSTVKRPLWDEVLDWAEEDSPFPALLIRMQIAALERGITADDVRIVYLMDN